jgi:hypothetical protein
MTSQASLAEKIAIWQGFRHTWEYNHRLNRFGSYITRRRGKDGRSCAVVGHTAASGTGNDTAHFDDCVAEVNGAQGVAVQTGVVQAVAECQRGDLTTFVVRVDDLPLDPALQGRDVYTVLLNGFDLFATEHSEKVMTFDLEVSEPTLCDDARAIRFYVMGDLRFDCRSPECQLLPVRLETEQLDHDDHEEETPVEALMDAHVPEPPPKRGIDRRKVDKAARWVKQKLTSLMGVEDVKRSILDEGGDTLRRRLFRLFGRRFFIRFLKWRFSAPYVIRVHYLIVAGDRDALTVTESPTFEHTYTWDMEHEIDGATTGVLPVSVRGDDPGRYAVNTLAFKRIFMDVTIDEAQGTEDPIQWGKGMHMLAWHHAIRDVQTSGEAVTAKLDLFYKNWSEAMNAVITLTTWGAVRAAGSARMGARLALLQLREAAEVHHRAMPGWIYWPGRGLSATRDPRARFERILTPTGTEGPAPGTAPAPQCPDPVVEEAAHA